MAIVVHHPTPLEQDYSSSKGELWQFDPLGEEVRRQPTHGMTRCN